MKKTIIILFFAFFPLTLYAQTSSVELEFTNTLIAARTQQGEPLFVFFYPDRLEFVIQRGRQFERIRLIKSPGLNIEDAFIVGHRYFITKAGGLHFFFDLSRLLNRQNDGQRLDRFFDRTMQGIDAVFLLNDTFYFTRRGTVGLYRFLSGNPVRYETAVANTNSSAGRQILFTPMLERRRREFSDQQRRVEEIILGYERFESTARGLIRDIERELARTAGQTTVNAATVTAAYNNVRNNVFNRVFRYDPAHFDQFRILARIVEDTQRVDSVINNTLQRIRNTTSNTPLSPALINDFNNRYRRWNNIRPDSERERRLEPIRGEIRTQENRLRNEWGNDFTARRRLFDQTNTRDWNWARNNNNLVTELTNNITTINNAYQRLSNQLLNDRFKSSVDYRVYVLLRNHFNELTGIPGIRNHNFLRDNPHIMDIIRTTGTEIFTLQTRLFSESRREFNTSYNNLVGLRTRLTTVEAEWRRERDTAEREKNEALNRLVLPLVNRYRDDIHSAVTNRQVPRFDFDRTLINFSIISNENSRIHGFRAEQVQFSDFDIGSPQLQRSSVNSLLSPVRNGVFMSVSRNRLAAFDTSEANFMAPENRIEPITINEGIAYLVTNSYNGSNTGQFQYLVTRDGQLLRFSIRNRRIVRESVGAVGSGAIVIVAGDNAFILGNGRVNGSASGEIRVKSNNSDDIFTINLQNGRFMLR